IHKNELNAFWADLETAFKYYRHIVKPDLEPNPVVAKSLRSLKNIEVTVHYPLLFNLYREYESNTLTAEQFQEALYAIETFLIRDIVHRARSQGLNKEFPLMFKKVKEACEADLVLGLKKTLNRSSYYRLDVAFRSSLIENPLKNTTEYLVKFILMSVEEYLSGKERPELEKWNVEPIMPETLTSSWKLDLPEKDFAEAKTFAATLGNLTLVEPGWRFSNSTFSQKKQYLNRTLHLNRYFDNLQSWDVENIRRRGEYLADLVMRIWPDYGLPKQYFDDITRTKPLKLVVLGQTSHPKTWKEVYVNTLNRIWECSPEKFKIIVETYPNRFTENPELHSLIYAPLMSGLKVVVSYTAKDLYEKSRESMELAGYDLSEWYVEYA
ncbi:MAG: HNH endonuclease family protein, partial [Bacteroidia bacterium]|nr:HNH endonuclease family protein [Bacteroidia bacterium]